jgi:hypothetical protein
MGKFYADLIVNPIEQLVTPPAGYQPPQESDEKED